MYLYAFLIGLNEMLWRPRAPLRQQARPDIHLASVSSVSSASPGDHGWRLALAGGIAGAISNSLLHPLDTVKTVRQADPVAFRGVIATARKIAATRGVTGLYAGIIPALFGSALSSALYFGAYELSKRRLSRAQFVDMFIFRDNRVALHAVSAVCGNVSSSILFVPKEVVKSRMQASTTASKSFFLAAISLVKSNGIPGLYKGYKATLLRNIPSTMLRFVAFEEFRRFIVSDNNNNYNYYYKSDLPLAQFLLAGALAGAIASGCTTPMDVLKTRFSTGRIPQGTGILPALKNIANSEGIHGLYAGVRPRMLWSALSTGIGFGSYELCKSLLNADSANTYGNGNVNTTTTTTTNNKLLQS